MGTKGEDVSTSIPQEVDTDSDDSDDNYNPKRRPNKAMKKTVVKMTPVQLKESTTVEGKDFKIGKKKPISVSTTKPLVPMRISSSLEETHDKSREDSVHIHKDNDYRRHLFVDCIPENFSENKLRTLFSKYGVTDIRLKLRRPGFPSYAFVSFTTTEQASTAMKEMHRIEIERGRKINVNIRSNDGSGVDRFDRGREREREKSRDIDKERDRPRDRDRETGNMANRDRIRDDRSRERGVNNVDFRLNRSNFDTRAAGGDKNDSKPNSSLNAGDEKRLEAIAEQKVKELLEQKLREKEQKEMEALREQMRRKDEIILKEKEERDKILKENEDMKRFIATKAYKPVDEY